MKRNRYINASNARSNRNIRLSRFLNNLSRYDNFSHIIDSLNILYVMFDWADTPMIIYDDEQEDNELVKGLYFHPILLPTFLEWLDSQPEVENTIDVETGEITFNNILED